MLYPVEESRGYQARGDLWSPGDFRLALTDGTRATLVASTESPETMNVLEPRSRWTPSAAAASGCWRRLRPRRARDSPPSS